MSANKSLRPSELLIHSTIRIECTDSQGNKSSGTGFFYLSFQSETKNFPMIITNKHVIRNAVSGTFYISIADPDNSGRPKYGHHKEFRIDNIAGRWIHHPDAGVDLAAMPCGDVINDMIASGWPPFYMPLQKSDILSDEELSKLSALEDIIMIGYPNGLWDTANNLPIMRHGITATPVYLDYLGKKEFVIDAACFPGSSGSPVFIVNEGSYSTRDGLFAGNRLIFLGILHAGPQMNANGTITVVDIPTAMTAVSSTLIMINLGYCIKAKQIEEIENYLISIGFQPAADYIHKPIN